MRGGSGAGERGFTDGSIGVFVFLLANRLKRSWMNCARWHGSRGAGICGWQYRRIRFLLAYKKINLYPDHLDVSSLFCVKQAAC